MRLKGYSTAFPSTAIPKKCIAIKRNSFIPEKKMKTSSKEHEAVSKAIGNKVSPKEALEQYFSPEKELSNPVVCPEEIRRILEEHCKKELTQYLAEQKTEHNMCMKERQASINTSNAITGVLITWSVIGLTMLAKSCINFDKGPKFKV